MPENTDLARLRAATQLTLFDGRRTTGNHAARILNGLREQAAHFRAAAHAALNDDARDWFSGAADASVVLADETERRGFELAGPAGAHFALASCAAGLPTRYTAGALAACETFAQALVDAERA
jgi:hypothetical protein